MKLTLNGTSESARAPRRLFFSINSSVLHLLTCLKLLKVCAMLASVIERSTLHHNCIVRFLLELLDIK